MILEYLAKVANTLDLVDTNEARQAAEGIDAVINSFAGGADDMFGSDLFEDLPSASPIKPYEPLKPTGGDTPVLEHPLDMLNVVVRELGRATEALKGSGLEGEAGGLTERAKMLRSKIFTRLKSPQRPKAEFSEEEWKSRNKGASLNKNVKNAADEAEDNPFDPNRPLPPRSKQKRTFPWKVLGEIHAIQDALLGKNDPQKSLKEYTDIIEEPPTENEANEYISAYMASAKIAPSAIKKSNKVYSATKVAIDEEQADKPLKNISPWPLIGHTQGRQDRQNKKIDAVGSLRDFSTRYEIKPTLDDALAFATAYVRAAGLDEGTQKEVLAMVANEFSKVGEVRAAVVIERLIKVANLLDSEGYEKAAVILDGVIKDAAELPKYPSRMETREELYDAPKHNKETMLEFTKKEVDENRKQHHLEGHRGTAETLQTRYSPELPGVSVIPVADGVVQDPVTRKIYDWGQGFNYGDKKRQPGGSVRHQTALWSQIAPPHRLFEDK